MINKQNKEGKSIPNRRRQAVSDERNTKHTNAPAFKRNRTLTGSSSRTIASSNELNADILSPRAKAHRLHRKRNGLLVRFVLVLFAALLLYIFLGQLIATNAVVGDVAGDAERTTGYEQRFNSYLTSRPVERFEPLLDIEAATQYMQIEYPEIDKVDVNLTGEFGKSQATVTLRKPVARWKIDSSVRYVDNTGKVFTYNAFANPSVEILDDSGIPELENGTVASNRFLGFVGRIVGGMKDQGYTVQRATIPPLSTRQLNIKVAKIPYVLKLITDRSAGEQVEDMERVITYLSAKKISPEYVDVRIKGKAYYK